jgi:hypothetical protein
VGTVVYMEGLALAGSTTSLGLQVTAATAWVDRSQIVQNTGGGILAESGAVLTLRNSFVGGDVSDASALQITQSSADVVYSTLGGGAFNASALSCAEPIAVLVRNSILVTRGGTPPDEVVCEGAVLDYSAMEGIVEGTENVSVGAFPGGMPTMWFVDYPTGDFHLQNVGETVFAEVAQWQLDDPATDIDGDARPTTNGAADYAGADVP